MIPINVNLINFIIYRLNFSLDLESEEEGLTMNGNSDSGNSHVYFLSETRKFRSVVELVTFYSRNSLKESFNGLDTPLRFPVGEVFLVNFALFLYKIV